MYRNKVIRIEGSVPPTGLGTHGASWKRSPSEKGELIYMAFLTLHYKHFSVRVTIMVI